MSVQRALQWGKIGSRRRQQWKRKSLEEEAEGTVARNPRAARTPIAPTKAMRLAHELHHGEYREWCEHCVAGKGVSHQHKSTDKGESTTAEFSLDYAFMTEDGRVGSKEDIGDEAKLAGATPVIVGYDHREKGVWALAVEHKGVNEESIKWTNGKINESGNYGTKITLKSDQEESIMAVKRAVAARRPAQTPLV